MSEPRCREWAIGWMAERGDGAAGSRQTPSRTDYRMGEHVVKPREASRGAGKPEPWRGEIMHRGSVLPAPLPRPCDAHIG